MELKLSAKEVETAIRAGFGTSGEHAMIVEEVRLGYARTRLPFHPRMLRPGQVISGPAIFTAADLAMYALVLAHIGPQLMAVTSDITLHFLNKGVPGDVIAEGRLLKLGRRLAVMETTIHSAANPTIVIAHASGSYALPAVPAI
jgi:uncharacterized protein (TIGR00369 family)